jgi:hypothetical protein
MAKPTTHEKALRINLDAAKYGTLAEIGAGQEVARWFFRHHDFLDRAEVLHALGHHVLISRSPRNFALVETSPGRSPHTTASRATVCTASRCRAGSPTA